MFKPLLNVNSSYMTFSDELYNSFKLEGTKLTSSVKNKLLNYDGYDLKTIHQIITESKCAFERKVNVYVKNNFDDVLHVGLQPSKINYEWLQCWVNDFYTYHFKSSVEKMFCGFILYLFYIRIHPHQDGNGRTSRYVFLENKLLEGTENYFPLSTIIESNMFRTVNNNMGELMKLIDFSDKNISEDKYYSLTLSDKNVKMILYIMYISIVYKHLKVSSPKECEIYEEYESFGDMISHYRNPLMGTTFTESDMSIVKDIKHFIERYVDIMKHSQVLKVLDVL